jgi:hypothetical protein
MTDEDDWRLQGQETYLRGAIWVRKRYRVRSHSWEHDHCSFCWAKFMDPEFSTASRAFIDVHPEVLIEGYASAQGHPREVDYYWVCEECFAAFSDRFAWSVVSEG